MDFEARIQELENQLKEYKDLLRDVRHRTKNNYLFVSSILRSERANIEDEFAGQIVDDCAYRIDNMGQLEDILCVSEKYNVDMLPYLYSIGEFRVSTSVRGQKIKMKYDLENIELEPKIAQYCGLAANEMLTNAIKYAFRKNPLDENNTITISLKYLDENLIRFEVRDNGSGISKDEEPRKNSYGTYLISTFVESIKGKYEIDTTQGTAHIIEFNHPKDMK